MSKDLTDRRKLAKQASRVGIPGRGLEQKAYSRVTPKAGAKDDHRKKEPSKQDSNRRWNHKKKNQFFICESLRVSFDSYSKMESHCSILSRNDNNLTYFRFPSSCCVENGFQGSQSSWGDAPGAIAVIQQRQCGATKAVVGKVGKHGRILYAEKSIQH